MEAAAFQNRPPLGRVLVECGLLSEEQVTEALQEQQRSGRKLGEILVSSGVVSGPAIANALAEQRGTVVKTEYGFGTGLASRRRATAAGAPPPAPFAAPALVAAPTVVAEPAPVAQEAPPAEAPDRLAELEADLAARESRIAELQAELARRAAKAEGLHARISQLEQEVGAAAQAPADDAQREQLAVALAAVTAERDELRARLATSGPSAAEAAGHVLVVPGESGYRLVVRQGSVPPVGSRVAVCGSVFVAAGVAPSPLRDGRPCVILAAAS